MFDKQLRGYLYCADTVKSAVDVEIDKRVNETLPVPTSVFALSAAIAV